MATAGTINIFVNAVTKKFDDGIKGVHTKLQGLTKGFADINGAVMVAQQAFATAGRVVSAFTDEIARLDEIGDIAARFDITTTAVQNLQRTIKLSGGEVESLTKLLGRLAVNLGDAAGGKGSAVGALKSLKLGAEQFQNMSLDKSFEVIAKQIALIPDPTRRAAIATDIFGKSAIEVMEIFTRENVFEQAAKEVDQFGVKMEGAADQIGKTAEAMERLEMSWGSLKGAMAVTAAPAATRIAETGASAIRSIGNLGLGEMLLLGSPLGTAIVHGQMRADADFAARMAANQTPGAPAAPGFGPQAPWAMSPDDAAFMRAFSQMSRTALGPAAPPPMRLNAKDLLLQVEAKELRLGGSAGALEFGSAAAFSAINQSQKEDELRRLQKQEVDETKKTNRLLEQMVDNAIFLEEATLQG